MKWIKRIFCFLLLMGLYFLPSFIFKTDTNFYNNLNGPKLPSIVFPIVWTTLYTLLSIHIIINFEKRKNYVKSDFLRWFIFLLVNYVISSTFSYFFFVQQNLFLGYVITLFTLLSISLACIESLLLYKRSSILLLPYVLWGIIASIFGILLYLNN